MEESGKANGFFLLNSNGMGEIICNDALTVSIIKKKTHYYICPSYFNTLP
jgi:hypothetical protein